MDLPVPLDHVCQLLVVHEAGGCAGVWGDPLKIMKVKSVVSNSATPGPVACQDSPSMGFSRPRVGCHFLLQRNFSDLGIEPGSPALQADSLLSEPLGKPPDNHEPSLDPLLVVLGVQFPSLPSTLNHATKFTPHQNYLRTLGLSAPADRGVCRKGI